MFDRIKIIYFAILDHIRGRVIPMYRRSGILFASRYMSLLGRIFLRTPIFTEAELKAAKNHADNLGIGPLPDYMRDEFQYWKTDRSVRAGADHLNGSILLSVYRNKSYKDLSWRAFAVGILFVGAISILDGGLWLIKDTVASVAHRAAYAISGPTKVADTTDSLLPDSVKKAIAAARVAKPELAQSKLDYIADTGSCSEFLADMPEAAQNHIDDAGSMLIVGDKMDVCRKAGYAYRADMVQALKPFQDRFTASDEKGKWVRLLQATTLPGQPTSLNNFSKCDATLASVLSNPSPIDLNQAHDAAECLAHGSHLPTDQD
ncbi:MAG: hypothetical protein EPN58_11250 [Rhodanobacter sp.]|nr:MAG: hypothetical protein EPN58_11250 [Rhodanobacter sp.]